MSVLDDATIIYVPGVYKTSAVALQKPISAGSVSSLTFARASTGTRVNSAGLIESVATNVPRVDYLNGSCGAQLLEPARTNLLRYSEQFDNAAWAKTAVTISANVTTSPDGTANADKMVPNGTLSASHRVFNGGLQIVGQEYTASVYAKAGGYDYIALTETGDAPSNTVFDLSNGTITVNASNGVIESVGNGWYRCSITWTAGDIGFTLQLRVFDNPAGGSFSGDGTSGVFLWGAQTEQGSYPTSYIKTEGSTVTRAAETLSQTGLATELGDSEGTIFFEGYKFDAGGASMSLSISDGTLNNRVTIGQNASTSTIISGVTVGGVVQASHNAGNWINGTSIRIAAKYSANDFALWVNGVEVATDNSGSTFGAGVLTQIQFNAGNGSIVPFYGNVKQLAIWDRALTDTELEDLTT